MIIYAVVAKTVNKLLFQLKKVSIHAALKFFGLVNSNIHLVKQHEHLPFKVACFLKWRV